MKIGFLITKCLRIRQGRVQDMAKSYPEYIDYQ